MLKFIDVFGLCVPVALVNEQVVSTRSSIYVALLSIEVTGCLAYRVEL
jgi:hypothetical protein